MLNSDHLFIQNFKNCFSLTPHTIPLWLCAETRFLFSDFLDAISKYGDYLSVNPDETEKGKSRDKATFKTRGP